MVGTDSARTDGRREKAVELEMIMAQHESALLRYATRILNDPDAAQDVVQDTFIKLCKGWKDGATPAPQLRGWLYRVAHNRAVDHIRRESRLRVLHEKQAEETAHAFPARQADHLHEADRRAAVLDHVRKLKPEEQQVVLLRMQEGLSYREIAEITKRTEGNVGCILHHAVKKLAKELKKAGVV